MKKQALNLEEKTDRELSEMRTKLLIDILKKQKGIKDNLDFFFWVAIVGIIVGVFLAFS